MLTRAELRESPHHLPKRTQGSFTKKSHTGQKKQNKRSRTSRPAAQHAWLVFPSKRCLQLGMGPPCCLPAQLSTNPINGRRGEYNDRRHVEAVRRRSCNPANQAHQVSLATMRFQSVLLTGVPLSIEMIYFSAHRFSVVLYENKIPDLFPVHLFRTLQSIGTKFRHHKLCQHDALTSTS